MATSRIPAAIEALVTRWTAALPGVLVLDGPTTGDLTKVQDLVFVGWQPNTENGLAVEMQQDFAHIGGHTRDERFDVLCYLEAWTGDFDINARRARAFELFAACENDLRASGGNPSAPNLGGAVLFSGITQGSLLQQQTDRGATVGIAFRVTCQARI
ncbi:hypothetical protein [Streptomyces sp. JB150]|uniref:hypothetical protein n=1 Tax=Streptomyces sp. JB150 TaxID=2714844 RepID=UPI00140A1E3D|nr:hypothetical protein [Streptomyces sp. JB150]QIJ62550.1 hypothetical protein G7Z13_11260 [Streptomyces sp. JB150]